MDQRRFEELERKKMESGLSREEADELGRSFLRHARSFITVTPEG
jgi:hypothetical protein